jgi:tetratricopeptide (TPR) repeat protein
MSKTIYRYQYVIFVDASSAESIKADLQSAIRSLGGKHSQDGFEDVFQFLADADNRNWLIIFDNADDPDLPLTTYIPKCEHGTIVITGRNHHLIQLAPASYLRLQGMTDSDSIQVLLKAAQRDLDGNEEEMASAIELCRSLGGLPLALVHVGCYCHTAQKSFSKYLKIFKEHRSKLMEMKPSAQLDEYSYSTYTSIHLSYSLLDESARKLFHLLAFFHPSSICVDIFQATVRYESLYWETLPREEQYGERWSSLRQILAPAGSWNDIYIDNLLHQLQNFSLISLSHLNEQTNITLHPLVKSCILDTLLPEDYSLYFYMAVLVLSSCGYREETHLFQYLTTHVAEMESCNMHIHPNDIAAFAYILYQNGNREESMKRWEIVRYWRKRVNGEQHKSTLRISFWIADCLRHLNRVEEAEAIIREVVGTQEKLLGGDHQHTFDSYRLLADILSEQSKTEEAEDILKHLLTLNGTKYDADDPTTLLVQSSLVDNLRIQHRLSETEALSKKILPTMREIFEEDDDITLHTLNNLSLALINQKKWAEAEDILSDVVAKRTRRYGKQHISTLTSLGNLAVCRLGRGKLNEADTIFREVLELRERTLGKDHPSTIHTRRWLEDVTQAQKSLRATTVQPGAHQGI